MALAVMSGRGLESVMVIALPVAVAASTLKLIMFTVRSYYMPLAEKYAREANVKGLIMVDIVGGLGLQFIIYFPFIKVLDRQALKEEAALESEEANA